MVFSVPGGLRRYTKRKKRSKNSPNSFKNLERRALENIARAKLRREAEASEEEKEEEEEEPSVKKQKKQDVEESEVIILGEEEESVVIVEGTQYFSQTPGSTLVSQQRPPTQSFFEEEEEVCCESRPWVAGERTAWSNSTANSSFGRAALAVARNAARRSECLVTPDGAIVGVSLALYRRPEPLKKQKKKKKKKKQGIFAGVRCYLAPGGVMTKDYIGRALGTVLRGKGGETCSSAEDNVTHVVCDVNFEGSLLLLKDKTVVLNYTWIVDSANHSIRQPVDRYLLRAPPPRPSVVVQEAPRRERRPRASYYACQQLPVDGQPPNYPGKNELVMDMLGALRGYYEGSIDYVERNFKERALGRTIKKVKSLTYALELDNLKDFPPGNANRKDPPPGSANREKKGNGYCGEGTRKKIAEILNTGGLEKLDFFKEDKTRTGLKELTQVSYIGPATAVKLMKKHGVFSIAQLRERIARDEKLDIVDNVYKTLRWHEDLQQRIPRVEVAEIEGIVAKAAKAVALLLGFEVTAQAVGSYRRGAKDCGDVDVLITCEQWRGLHNRAKRERADVMKGLLKSLHKSGFLTDDLAGNSTFGKKDKQDEECGAESYMGICKPGALHRRLDVKIYAPEHYAYALLYFTGSGHFNRSMRHYAKSINMSLSDTGLWLVKRSTNNKPSKDAAKLKLKTYTAETEREVFVHLGLDWREPHERSCADNAQEIANAANTKNEEKAAQPAAVDDEDSDDDDGDGPPLVE